MTLAPYQALLRVLLKSLQEAFLSLALAWARAHQQLLALTLAQLQLLPLAHQQLLAQAQALTQLQLLVLDRLHQQPLTR